jgi:hypothetical protein
MSKYISEYRFTKEGGMFALNEISAMWISPYKDRTESYCYNIQLKGGDYRIMVTKEEYNQILDSMIIRDAQIKVLVEGYEVKEDD